MFQGLPIILFLLLISGQSFSQQPKLILPIGHSERVVSAKFSPDGKLALTVSTDGTAKLWEAESGKVLKDFKAGGDASIVLVTDANFSDDGKKVTLDYEGLLSKVYDIRSGQMLEYLDIPGKTSTTTISEASFSPDGKRMLIPDNYSDEKRLIVCNYETLKPLLLLKGFKADIVSYQYSNDGKKILAELADSTIRTWDALTGKPIIGNLRINEAIWSVNFSPDSKKIFVELEDGSLKILDAITGKQLLLLKGADTKIPATGLPRLLNHADGIMVNENADRPLSVFSPDGKLWIKLYGFYDHYDGITQIKYWDSVSVRNMQSGKLLYTLNKVEIPVSSDFLTPDGKKLVVARKDGGPNDPSRSIYVLDAMTGKELYTISGTRQPIYTAVLSLDGKKLITSASSNPVRIWDVETGKLITSLKDQPSWVYDARFSPDNKKVITACGDKAARIWDIDDGKQLVVLKGRTLDMVAAKFDSSGKKILITTPKKNMEWDIENNSLSRVPGTGWNDSTNSLDWHSSAKGGTVFSPDSALILVWMVDIIQVENMKTNESYSFWSEEKEVRYDVQFSPDYKRLLVTSANHTIKLYDIKSAKPLFTFVAIDSTDFLVADSSNRYDGTEAARKLLYFTCGNEIIELDQVKDQLWVPDLAERINRGETINAKAIEELGICGLTPLLERGSSATEYYFKIKPRRGGIGKTVINVNGIEFSSYSPAELKKSGNDLEIRIPKDQLKAFFAENQENLITVRSQTADNATYSRTLSIVEDPDKEKRAPPNLFGVMIGVSNYKGESMDLQYAATDATDISSTVADAAKKLLGKEHVFMYNLTTDSGHVFPEKKTIKRTFDAIAAKAGPNDILFIFLSGHGVMLDKTKQFYYMTADASSLTEESLFKDVGISMTELADWIKPQNIKAQKRILILDACKSGQAINDIITPDQRFLAVKGDDNAQQVKAIDKLNEKSGLFILSASASSQLAFESGIYEHGYLTYSLLKAIKDKPDILEDGKYLNVSRWFNTAAQTVSELAKLDRARQEPQIVTNTDFNVGLVDNEVIARISLSETKTLFTSGNFLNSSIIDDDLGLRKLIDKRLGDISRTEAGKNIIFLPATNSPGAYSLTGGYVVKENSITIKVNLKKDNDTKQQFDMTGTKDKLNELADAIIAKAIEWIEENK